MKLGVAESKTGGIFLAKSKVTFVGLFYFLHFNLGFVVLSQQCPQTPQLCHSIKVEESNLDGLTRTGSFFLYHVPGFPFVYLQPKCSTELRIPLR